MSQVDFWYVRFPDGRVLRAASTAVLRQELSARHIPVASTVRRSPSDEWVSLEWTQEFADVVEELAAHPPIKVSQSLQSPNVQETDAARSTSASADHAAGVGSRLDPARLHLVGVRSHLDEMLAALDSALAPKKLLLGLFAGLLFGALLLLLSEHASWFESDSPWLPTACIVVAVCSVLFDVLIGILTRLTYSELYRLRPARWRHGLDRLGRLTIRVVLSKLIVWGYIAGLILLLRWLPFWVGPGPQETLSDGGRNLGGVILVLCILGEILLYPVFFFWLLLPPLLVVEGCLGRLSDWLLAAFMGVSPVRS